VGKIFPFERSGFPEANFATITNADALVSCMPNLNAPDIHAWVSLPLSLPDEYVI
jgi:hypothetical protein